MIEKEYRLLIKGVLRLKIINGGQLKKERYNNPKGGETI